MELWITRVSRSRKKQGHLFKTNWTQTIILKVAKIYKNKMYFNYSNPKLFIEAETPFQQQNHRDSHGCSKLIDKRCINSYGNLTLLI